MNLESRSGCDPVLGSVEWRTALPSDDFGYRSSIRARAKRATGKVASIRPYFEARSHRGFFRRRRSRTGICPTFEDFQSRTWMCSRGDLGGRGILKSDVLEQHSRINSRCIRQFPRCPCSLPRIRGAYCMSSHRLRRTHRIGAILRNYTRLQ